MYKVPWPRRASADPCRRAIVWPRGVRGVGRWAGRPAPARRVRRPWLARPDRAGPVGSWVDRPAPARRVRRPWLAWPDRAGPVGSWVDRPAQRDGCVGLGWLGLIGLARWVLGLIGRRQRDGRIALARRFRLGLAVEGRSGRRIRGRRSSRAGCRQRIALARRFRLGLAVGSRSGRLIRGRRTSRAGCRRQRLRGRLGAGTLLDRRVNCRSRGRRGLANGRPARFLVAKLLGLGKLRSSLGLVALVQQVVGLVFGHQARRFGGRGSGRRAGPRADPGHGDVVQHGFGAVGREGRHNVHPLGLQRLGLSLVELAQLHKLAGFLDQHIIDALAGSFPGGGVADLISLAESSRRGGDLVRVLAEEAVAQVPALDLLRDGLRLIDLVICQGGTRLTEQGVGVLAIMGQRLSRLARAVGSRSGRLYQGSAIQPRRVPPGASPWPGGSGLGWLSRAGAAG